jgi:SAM-dependent methyltransferase
VTTIQYDDLLRSWELQQEHYIEGREARFEVMSFVLAQLGRDELTVCDVACGPGSASLRLLRALPGLRIVAVDADPVLLRLARHHCVDFADRIEFHQVDLEISTWTEVLGGRTLDAAVSSTALHWLPAASLVRCYQQLGAHIRPGGVLLNADHHRFGPSAPARHDLAIVREQRFSEQMKGEGALDWEQWWQEIAAIDGFADDLAFRNARFAGTSDDDTDAIVLDLHVAALRTAGFDDVGPIWQLFDDYVLFARRAEDPA